MVLVSTIGASPGIDLAQRLGLPSLWLIYEWPVAARHLTPHLELTWPAYALEQANEALRRCPLIIFDSDAYRREYLERAPSERLLTIPGAIDIAEIDRFRASFDRASARRACGLPEGALRGCPPPSRGRRAARLSSGTGRSSTSVVIAGLPLARRPRGRRQTSAWRG